jgi:hypothetical protein
VIPKADNENYQLTFKVSDGMVLKRDENTVEHHFIWLLNFPLELEVGVKQLMTNF